MRNIDLLPTRTLFVVEESRCDIKPVVWICRGQSAGTLGSKGSCRKRLDQRQCQVSTVVQYADGGWGWCVFSHLPVNLKLSYPRSRVCYQQSSYVNNWCVLLRSRPTRQVVKDIAKTGLSLDHSQESVEERQGVRRLAPRFEYTLRQKGWCRFEEVRRGNGEPGAERAVSVLPSAATQCLL